MKRILRFFRNLQRRIKRPQVLQIQWEGVLQDSIPIGAECGLLKVRLLDGRHITIAKWSAVRPDVFDRAWESFPQEAYWEDGDFV